VEVHAITWITFLLGTLALIGTRASAGFYSKDSIWRRCITRISPAPALRTSRDAGLFVTSFYSFRLYFIVFHGKGADGSPYPGAPA